MKGESSMEEKISAELAENLAAANGERARAYRLLARLFEREVDAGLVEHMRSDDAFASEDADLQASFDALRADLEDGGEQRLEELAVAYNRVFYGMGPRTAKKAFPYESVYTSAKGLMMQDAYEQARKDYREAGVAKNPSFTEPDDHVAVELAFMARMCELAVETLRAQGSESESQMRAQRSFLQRHLLNWTDRFVVDVRAADEGFYGHAATLLAQFLQADLAFLDEVVS